MAWISFRVPNVCEALKTQKNPRHVPCPLKSNRTAVGLFRASMSFTDHALKDADGGDKPGHDGKLAPCTTSNPFATIRQPLTPGSTGAGWMRCPRCCRPST